MEKTEIILEYKSAEDERIKIVSGPSNRKGVIIDKETFGKKQGNQKIGCVKSFKTYSTRLYNGEELVEEYMIRQDGSYITDNPQILSGLRELSQTRASLDELLLFLNSVTSNIDEQESIKYDELTRTEAAKDDEAWYAFCKKYIES